MPPMILQNIHLSLTAFVHETRQSADEALSMRFFSHCPYHRDANHLPDYAQCSRGNRTSANSAAVSGPGNI